MRLEEHHVDDFIVAQRTLFATGRNLDKMALILDMLAENGWLSLLRGEPTPTLMNQRQPRGDMFRHCDEDEGEDF
jgi:hypothetical protein